MSFSERPSDFSFFDMRVAIFTICSSYYLENWVQMCFRFKFKYFDRHLSEFLESQPDCCQMTFNITFKRPVDPFGSTTAVVACKSIIGTTKLS